MPRQVLIQNLAAIYHVMSRGNPRQEIQLYVLNWRDFLTILAGPCQKPVGRAMHAYCPQGRGLDAFLYLSFRFVGLRFPLKEERFSR